MGGVTSQRTARRTDALTSERIVAAAIDILDTDGERGLTFRTLATRLSTGAGALYWHVGNKDALLAAATEHVVGTVVTSAARDGNPRDAIRALALGLFDAVDAHPWVGSSLNDQSWQVAMVQILEGLGGNLVALGVPDDAQFDCATAVLNYVLGVAGQNAAHARTGRVDRVTFLANVAAQWQSYDADRYPFVHRIAAQLPRHDDREQFLAGIDLILAGIDAEQ